MTGRRRTTRSRAPAPDLPPAGEIERLKLSAEVAWYLADRGIPLPDCPPLVKAPEPRDVPGVVFDPDRVDRVLKAFRQLRHTQGRFAGKPLAPDPWQVAYVIAPVFGWVRWDDEAGGYVRVINVLYVDVPRKNGKGLYAGEMILTADGWKKFGDLEVGDQVHAVDGSLTRVCAVSPIRELDCYKVTFGDGQSVVCDSDHLWRVFDRYGHDPEMWQHGRTVGRRLKGSWRTIDAPELERTHRCGSRGDTRYSVRMDRILERPTADLPIDPYLLGLWLGDGHTAAARITSADESIVRAFVDSGYTVRRQPGTITYGINGGFLVQLRALGVLGFKHVPERYLLADAEQRMALLQGLMDSDGTVITGPNTPRVEFTITKRTLADAVLFLARSLGWKPSCKEGRATLNDKDCGPRWRIAWTAYADRPPFRLERKRRKLAPTPGQPTRASTNTVAHVERVPTVPTRCIQVEHPSRQFLVGEGLIPTHNSTLSGGIAIYLTCADGESGAQVVTAATSENQAGFVFGPIKLLAEKSPALKKHVRAHQKRVVHTPSGSYVAVVASVGDAQHGANIHGAVIDELHLHKTPDLVEAIETGTGSRTQPLIVIITTADSGKPNTIYSRKRERIEQLGRGALKDETTYGVIWACEKDDDPHDEATWRKANPGFGISPTRAYLLRKSNEAKESPADLAVFQRLHLGLRTKQETKYLTLAEWDRNAGMVVEPKLAGATAYGGLDLGSTSDLTSLCWVFPDGSGGFDALWRYWAPEASLEALDKRTAGMASVWVRNGRLTLTSGNVTDYEVVKSTIQADLDTFGVTELGFDPWNATDLTNRLMAEGAPMMEVRQGYASLSPPLKEVKRLLLEGTHEAPRLRHGGNPVSRWMVDNLAVAMDPAGNVKPDKGRASEKIDGVSALVTAMSRAMHHQVDSAPTLWLGGADAAG